MEVHIAITLFVGVHSKILAVGSVLTDPFELDRIGWIERGKQHRLIEKVENLTAGGRRSILADETIPANVLAIDGGGIRGVVPATILQEIETRLGEPTRKIFDLVVGTSTGGLLSVGLTTPKNPKASSKTYYTANDMVTTYEALSARIFSTPISRKVPLLGGIFGGISKAYYGHEYDHRNLEGACREMFSDGRLADINLPAVLTSVDVERRSLKLFRSHRARSGVGSEPSSSLVHVLRATSAAPTFFEEAKVPIHMDRPQHHVSLVDGGLAANNPSLIALEEAWNLFGARRPVNLISVGTGETEAVAGVSSSGWLGSEVKRVIELMFASQAETVSNSFSGLERYCERAAGACNIEHIRLQPTFKQRLMEMDRYANVPELREDTKAWFRNTGYGAPLMDKVYDRLSDSLGRKKSPLT